MQTMKNYQGFPIKMVRYRRGFATLKTAVSREIVTYVTYNEAHTLYNGTRYYV